MKTREMICINCPMGCSLTVTQADDGTITVTGNTCKRGETYGITEMTAPKRVVTSIVKVDNREDAFVSVKSAAPITKSKMFEAMDIIRAAKISAPVKIGDIVIKDILGETDIIATSTID